MKFKAFYAKGDDGFVDRLNNAVNEWLESAPDGHEYEIVSQALAWSGGGNLTMSVFYKSVGNVSMPLIGSMEV